MSDFERLLRGEISSAQYVTTLRARAHGIVATYKASAGISSVVDEGTPRGLTDLGTERPGEGGSSPGRALCEATDHDWAVVTWADERDGSEKLLLVGCRRCGDFYGDSRYCPDVVPCGGKRLGGFYKSPVKVRLSPKALAAHRRSEGELLQAVLDCEDDHCPGLVPCPKCQPLSEHPGSPAASAIERSCKSEKEVGRV